MRRKLKVTPGQRVLEIGSGGRPHEAATVLSDRFPSDASHREGRALQRDGRPYLVCDGERLPFRKGAFDYVICMHVLEHATDPDAMLSEMQRVARAGYIETPTELHDFLFAVPPYTEIHRWWVNRVGDAIHLTEKTPDAVTHRVAPLLDYLRRNDAELERWMERRPQLFTMQYEWSGKIQWRVTRANATASAPRSFSRTVRDDAEAAEFLRGRMTHRGFYWGSGLWGWKRWLYAHAVHPRWRKWAKRIKN
jgi:SAM-dependent methyltransferase